MCKLGFKPIQFITFWSSQNFCSELQIEVSFFPLKFHTVELILSTLQKEWQKLSSDNEEAALSTSCTACLGRSFSHLYLINNEWNEEECRNGYRSTRAVLALLTLWSISPGTCTEWVVTWFSAPALPLYMSTLLAHVETASVVPLLQVPFLSPTSLNWQLHQIFCTLCTENIHWTWTDILSSSLDLTLETQALYLESFKDS